ncbi:MAG TPA: methyltransferase domain-containing protein [Candidatus Limnocylindrales bacterium]|nr:methyltransferase domain-containing protein [Candidatus Limnocylindrales bacterium]
MRRLVDVREHLDGDLREAAILEGNLRDLRRINRVFGGTRLSVEAVRRLVEARRAGGRPIRLLDVGTGAADIPLALLRALGPWSSIEVMAVDSRREVLDAATRVQPELATEPGLSMSLADGRALPYPDRAYDVAHASLVLHHLDREDAVAFLRELARVASIGVVVNDLARSRLALIGAWLVLHATTRNPWTLHDGVLSVRRAWTVEEAEELLGEAGLRPIGRRNGLGGHRWATGAVRR